MMALWGANIILKGITELNDYSIDIDERKAMFKQHFTVKKKQLSSGWTALPL